MRDVTDSILWVDCWFEETFKPENKDEELHLSSDIDWYYHACTLPEEIECK